jgi:anti-sigma regulatory factor (Ser/Thr protein kinase)
VKERRITVPSDATQLPVLTRFLQEFWAGAGLPPASAPAFELALEEVFMNVVLHGSPAGSVPLVEVSLTLSCSALTMTIADDGPQFDPLSLPAPDLTASLAQRRVGGHGVSLVRQMMDTVSYRRVAERNQLRLSKRLVG